MQHQHQQHQHQQHQHQQHQQHEEEGDGEGLVAVAAAIKPDSTPKASQPSALAADEDQQPDEDDPDIQQWVIVDSDAVPVDSVVPGDVDDERSLAQRAAEQQRVPEPAEEVGRPLPAGESRRLRASRRKAKAKERRRDRQAAAAER